MSRADSAAAAKVALLFPASRTIANVTTWAVRRGK